MVRVHCRCLYIQGSSRVGRIFIFQNKNWLKGYWNVPAIQLTEWSLNGGWNATEIHLSPHHSVAIQPPFSQHSVDWKVRFHPVKLRFLFNTETLIWKKFLVTLKLCIERINFYEIEIEHAFYQIKSILFTMQLTFQFYFRVY